MSAQKLGKLVDGIFVPSSSCIEPIGVPQCREFYRARGQKLFTVGLNTPHKSVLYISFGSVCFPVATLQLIEALVDTLLALDTPFPFIFALGGKMAFLPDALVERLCFISLGIPLIIWPTNSEQPVNAALLALSAHPVAIELMQVRTGMQLAPALRGGPTVAGTVADASAEFKAAFDAALCAGGECDEDSGSFEGGARRGGGGGACEVSKVLESGIQREA
ncbi:hypothetical protein B0H13DRAFT_1923861 [Mycena leptocephala]|nr:hypothetical protein B0H13DRAFT_1923861 [Mycena leptocephala]